MFDFFDPLLIALNTSPYIYVALVSLFGLLAGSFLNVVIHRLPKMMELAWRSECRALLAQGQDESAEPSPSRYNLLVPRSACPSCGHRITALQNIPLISYAVLGGKCASCKSKISLRYPLVELLTGALAGVIAWKFGISAMTVAALIFSFALIALTFIDFETQLLPDDITLPLLWLGIFFNIGGGFTDLQSAVIGAIAGYLSLWSIYWAFKLLTGKEGMGYGDFKLLAAIGAWFGWQLLPAVILLASVAGSVIGIALVMFARHRREVPIPFGPFLASGGIAALFWGPQLAGFYLAG